MVLGTWDGDPGDTWDSPGVWDTDTAIDQIRNAVLIILRRKWSYAIPEFLELEFSSGDVIEIPLVNKWGDPGMIWGEFVWGNAPLVP